ncbi:uncharacterized protein LOC125842883 [Solanum stenotomum]|uniref:uncharacterized protein LOC125842883 n=1 Tax=Solanum stenotomum TaxID=172797 RepID=UPI0020D0BF6B|nr:uncharacterized protein LOC125842883 [Solanum stenotomum]
MSISRLMTHAQQVEGDKLKEIAKDNKKAITGNHEYSQQKLGGGNRSTYPTCPKCCKNHQGECLAGKEGYFGCSQTGHRLRYCPSSIQGQGGNNSRAQSIAPAALAGRPTQQGVSSGISGG